MRIDDSEPKDWAHEAAHTLDGTSWVRKLFSVRAFACLLAGFAVYVIGFSIWLNAYRSGVDSQVLSGARRICATSTTGDYGPLIKSKILSPAAAAKLTAIDRDFGPSQSCVVVNAGCDAFALTCGSEVLTVRPAGSLRVGLNFYHSLCSNAVADPNDVRSLSSPAAPPRVQGLRPWKAPEPRSAL